MSTSAIARNAPCPCGSGKRFKDCHGAVGAVATQTATADDLMLEAQEAARLGRWAVALASLRHARELAPDRADILREQARAEWTLHDPQAAASCRAALQRAPGDLAARNLLGEILFATDPATAETIWRELLELDADNAEALFHLGNRLRERGEHQAAIDHYERALKRTPGHPGVLNNLGLALEAIGQRDRAEACYDNVLATQPQHADALANLANLRLAKDRYLDAVAYYDRALAVRRNFPASFWHAHGLALTKIGAFGDAEQSLREAERLAPDEVSTQILLGSTCLVQGKYDEAEARFAHALELEPGNIHALMMLTHARMYSCSWNGVEEAFAGLRALIMDERPQTLDIAAPLPLLAMPLGADARLAAARRWASRFVASTDSRRPPAVAIPTAGARTRVGFASSDLRDHPIGLLLVECLERLDRSRIEAFAYSLAPQNASPLSQRIAQAPEHFVDCSFQTAEEVAGRIRGDGVQVLIDLNGYTTHAKSEIFAFKPAPLQLSWLGYLGSLGAPWYDYVITDRFVSPPAAQAHLEERLLYLPDCYCPSDTKRVIARAAPGRAACGLPESGFVFCCFNASYKILPSVFAVWMRLLCAVPGSVLWLAVGNPAAENLRREAAARGVDPARLVFAPRVEPPEHLARHVHADLFLDTLPYNAGTTANDALFMGLPLLTCAGQCMASRVAGSQLHAIGLPELVTTSLTDYEALALALARDPQRLHEYRQRLQQNRSTHALFDMARFTCALDDLLIAAWENRGSREKL